MSNSGRAWPIAIVAFLIFVVVFNIGFVVLASKTAGPELTSQPYEKGLAYQDEINLESVAKRAGLAVTFNNELVSGENLLIARFATKESGALGSEISAEFWRPDGSQKDLTFKLQCSKMLCRVKQRALSSGLWFFKLKGKLEDQDFLLKGSVAF